MCPTASERARRGRARVALALSLSLAPFVAGCGGGETSAARPNVLVISIDSLRADHLGTYGYGRDTSPTIDALARAGSVFEHAASQAPWTLPAHASLLTSLHERTHQASDVDRRLDPARPTLASVLRAAGYATRAIVSGAFLQARFGLDSGFEVYDDRLAKVGNRKSHEVVTSDWVNRGALELLDGAHEPFFLFVHYWDVHYDYLPPAPYDTKFAPDYHGTLTSARFMENDAIRAGMDPDDVAHLEALYDGEIAWVDAHVGALLAELTRRGLDQRTIVVLTADHGDEFFEHGEKGHMHSLYEELLHVPLVVRAPGLPAGGRVAQRVGLIDVMPTVLELAGVAAPAGLEGHSLAPLLRGEPWTARPVFSETTKARKSKAKSESKTDSWCVYDGDLKRISFAGDRYPPEVYDLAADSGEQHRLPDAAALERQLAEWFERVPAGEVVQNTGVDDETLRNLRALGYVDK